MSRPDVTPQDLLAQLKSDQQSGATQLALNTLDALASHVEQAQPSARDLTRLLEALQAARPSMVVIGNALAKIRARVTGRQAADRETILEIRSQLQRAADTIARRTCEQLPRNPVIMTHSASSAVVAVFQRLAEQGLAFSVICTQSSPGFEGHSLATTLNELAVPVTLITDAQMGLFAPQADLVVTGCDTWLTRGFFINKSGTHLLALAARASGKPFWVLADSFRDSDADPASVELEEMSGKELNGPGGRWITPRNVYFERVPQSLVNLRISEQGVFSCPAGPGP